MKKKLLIEMFVYIMFVILGVILMFTYKPKEIKIVIPNDFRIERGEENALVYFE